MSDKLSVAVIGLGSMGYGAATSLIKAGFETRGCDLRPRILENFEQAGGVPFRTAAEAAQGAAVVLLFVVNAEQVEQVVFGEDGILKSATRGTAVICCATTPPSFATALGERLIKAGMMLLDAPVSGGAAKAMSGEMTIMASGSDAALSKAATVLNAIATKVYKLGDQPGKGSQVKMINQLLAGVHIAATAEALTLGIRQGLDPGVLLEVISECAGSSWMFQNRGPHIVDGDYTPHSAVDIFVKDMGIVTGEAAKCDFPVPLSEVALGLFQQASENGYGAEDDAAVAKVYAESGSIQLPAK